LQNVTSIVGELIIEGNPALSSLEGANNIISVGELKILSNKTLKNLSGLTKLNKINYILTISGNDEMSDLSGTSISSIGLDVIIRNNKSLKSLSGLSKIFKINANLIIEGNDGLENLTGIDNISIVDGSVKLKSNNLLNTVSGMQRLSSIGNSFIIDNNPLLENLFDLKSMVILRDSLVITNNTKLSGCAIRFICDFVSSNKNLNVIANNGPLCQTVDEIKQGCIVSAVNEINISSVYPNPASNFVILELPDENGYQYKIIDLYGRTVKYGTVTGIDNLIGLQEIGDGIYFIELQLALNPVRMRFVKNN
jgi:hypothetical protein